MDMQEVGERLARIETKQDSLIEAFGEHKNKQEEHNDAFYKTAGKVSSFIMAIKIISPIITVFGGIIGWAVSLVWGHK